jgi:methionyl aminopeptidase
MIYLKKPEEIEKMRAAGRVIHLVMKAAEAAISPGITTGQLEDIAVKIIADSGGTSPFVGYAPAGHPPFPAWTCISTNDEVVHGIPGRRVLKEGDIVTVDCGVELDGWLGDSAWTFPVGKVSAAAERLLKVTEESLYKGIEQAKAGNRTGDIGHAVQKFVEAHGYSVVRELSGHGVGRSLHEDPQVYNYGQRGKGELLQCGMTFAIEPMVNSGRKETKVLTDRWTIATADRKYSAHFEHTVAITPDGALILTNGD